MDSSIVTAAIVALASALLIRLSYSWLLPRPIPNIPHNPIISVLGDIPAMLQYERDGKGSFTEFVNHNASMHGPISQVLLGWHRAVVVTDRAEADRIALGGRVVDVSDRVRLTFATALPDSQLSLTANDRWKKHRRFIGPSMSKRYLERMFGRISFGANELTGLWRAKHVLVGSIAFDTALDFHLTTMDNIVNIALGDSISCIKSAYSVLPSIYSQSSNVAYLPAPEPPSLYKAGKGLIKGFETALKSPFTLLTTWIFTYTSPTWWRNYNMMISFFTNALLRAREREAELARVDQGPSTSADCVLDMIVQREMEVGAETLGDKDILDELITYVFAGQDTTASALSWLAKYLPTDPEIQRRLRNEMRTVFGEDPESDEFLDFNLLDDPERVPILEAIIAETMRCAGVGAFVPRQRTQVLFAVDLMSKDEAEWGPDAKEWRPSRWLTPGGSFNRSAGPSIPFGMGQRSCFGQRLVILQLKAYLATMSRVFFFKPVPPEVGSWEAVELILRRPKLCYVSLERWDSKNHS